MKDVVIVSACRTAIGTFGGTLKDVNGAAIAAATMKEVIRRAGIEPALIGDIRYGCCLEPTDTLNVTRVAALLAGIPDTVPAVTINRVCISGMEAVLSGMAMIQAGLIDVVLAGGVEHMSGAPYTVENARWGCRLQDQVFVDRMIRALHCGSHVIPHPEDGPVDAEQPPVSFFKGKPYIMGHTAEFIAQHHGISREAMDEIALRSHNNAERATRDGDFAEEIVALEVPRRKKPPLVFDRDEHFRPGMTMEDLRKLPPAFVPDIGKVTAGNSSGLNDGSAALLIMGADKARELGLAPLARLRARGRGGRPAGPGRTEPAAAVHLHPGGLRTDRTQRGLCGPVSRLRDRTGTQPRDHQCERFRHRTRASRGGHGRPDHGDPAPRPQAAQQIPGPGYPLRRRRGFHGLCAGNAMTGDPP